MPRKATGTVIVGEKATEDGDYLLTSFKPPVRDLYLFEVTTGAFPIHEIVRSKDDHTKIKGVVYLLGDRSMLDKNLDKLRDDIEGATNCQVEDKVRNLGSSAVESATG